jgi:hypothetical protein
MDPDGKLPPFITPDELISARVDGAATVQRKMERASAPRHAGAQFAEVVVRRSHNRQAPVYLGRRIPRAPE